MALLTLANVGHQYGTHIVLDGATLSIDPGEKIGLVGRNGSGKTTLMRVMLGLLEPDQGAVQFQRGGRVGYLSQDPDFRPEDTLRDAAERAFEALHALHVEMNEIYDAMGSAEPDEIDALLKRQSRVEAEIESAGGYAIDHRIDAMLHGLGFTDDQFGLPVSKLSGGQKGRLGLARLLLEAPDLLLLDEPTNHLDIEGRRWLETFLADEYRGAVIVVSHDRWLLDRVATRIVEVERGAILEYPGNYQKYVALREERQMTRARVHEKQLDKIRQEKQFIAKYKTGQRAKQARGRQSRLDRFRRDELVERPAELSVMRLKLPKAPRSGDLAVVADGISKSYGDLKLFENFDLTIQRGERLGIIGPNGVGKSTLIRVLLDDLEPDEGEVRLGSRISVGYYRQLHEHLDMSLTIWQYLQSVIVSLDGAVRASEQQARDLAGAFLFSGGEQDKTLGTVSGGERSRAVLAGLVAGAHNLLVLDEPTNHLDIPSSERLEQALARDGGYEGTLILISHDRALLTSTCDRLLVFDGDGVVRVFPGSYPEWEERRLAEAAAASAPPAPVAKAVEKKKGAGEKQKQKQKPKQKPKGKLARLTLEELEAKIEALETRRNEIDTLLCDPEVFNDPSRGNVLLEERGQLDAKLTPLEQEWAGRG